MQQKTDTQNADSLYAESEDNAFLGYPYSPSLISTADPDFEENPESAAKVSPSKKATDKSTRKFQPKRSNIETLLVGLDLGTNSTYVQIAEPGAQAVEASDGLRHIQH